MKTILVLMDSLNRHYLKPYNPDSWVQTPNLCRLAERGLVFDNHYAGSLPCMPARREMMTGRYNFLETPWGPIEPWDDCLPTELRRQKDTYTHLITDHYHYFHRGGNGYHYLFNSWEFVRGQESDVWRPRVARQFPPEGARESRASKNHAYWSNRGTMDPENDTDYTTPQCFKKAIDFLDHNHAQDNWHLHLEVFDPHEPFDCPSRYRDLYDDTYDGPHFTWPNYEHLDAELDGTDTVDHIRKCYAGSLTMADAWLGKLLGKMDDLDLWEDTVLILTTDHGHLLGEHQYWAKNYMFVYNELAHTPMIVCAPGIAPGRRQGLTATIDLMPTLMDLHGADLPTHVQGKSFGPLIEDDVEHHDWVLYGYFGKDINMTDGKTTYCRQPTPGATLYHHTACPADFNSLNRKRLRQAEVGNFLPAAGGIPHYRVPCGSSRHHNAPDFNPIYNLMDDPGQTAPLCDPDREPKFARIMAEKLMAADAPECQFDRVGLTRPS
ncbi:MAG: sulfatase-like hydrolase/transferase [Lentisphaerae bacterium]|nr:sulfatase-like hydrolase/transferase [Lentisphaerota bacterium]MBT4822297.1 sulfatase-like hydrolase/transferase [Lentisphaerota bacterium]MBT5607951.1 sulfatase-like hydrolase/transferase [Lentisphaerota bacterium]MBT7056529.1 sulfatase-like hydrolase/transferase [Lentisphaerota bacterium]MBT7846320.1 sulfatase-like hydrolase/transferase [Lentisphaerota bacterium]